MRLRVDDIALRLVSLLLALSLWFAVAAEKSAEAPVQAPIELRNVPDKLEVVGDLPRSIEVWVRGAPGLVQRVGRGEVYAQLDLQGAQAGVRTAHLTAKDIHVPYAVTVVAVRPSVFSFTLEPTLQRSVPVKARLEGQPAHGFRVAGSSAVPEQIVVAGPSSRVARLDGIETQPVSVEQARITVTRDVAVELPDPLVRLVDSAGVRVTAKVEASRAADDRKAP
jgi:YbbR domain-containing protein